MTPTTGSSATQNRTRRVQTLKRRLMLLRTASFSVTIGPLVGMLIGNWSQYVKSAGDAVRLTLGGIMVVVILIMTSLGKLGVPRRIVVEAVLLALVYFLRPLLSDIGTILTVALIGEMVDFVFLKRAIKNVQDRLLAEKTSDMAADKTASRMEEVLNNYFGGGRV